MPLQIMLATVCRRVGELCTGLLRGKKPSEDRYAERRYGIVLKL